MQRLENVQLLLGIQIQPAFINIDERRRGNRCSRRNQWRIRCIGRHGHTSSCPDGCYEGGPPGPSTAGENLWCADERAGGSEADCVDGGAEHGAIGVVVPGGMDGERVRPGSVRIFLLALPSLREGCALCVWLRDGMKFVR
jgi:hypothetical protein